MPSLLARSAALTGYVAVAREAGVDPFRLAASLGLPAACLTDPDLLVPSDLVGALLEVTARRSGAADIGLRIAEGRRLANLGPMGMIAREQPTLGAALDTLIHYAWLQNQALAFRLERTGEVALLRMDLAGGARPGRQGAELTLAVLVRTLRALLGESWRPEMVAFQHGAPDNIAAHRRVLGLTPDFGMDFTGLAITAAELDAPIPTADPDMARQVRRWVDQIAARPREDILAAVRELILALLPTGGCSAERVAAHLGVTRRTLHRRLERRGAVFSRLIDDARREIAQAHLAAGDRSLTEIAGLAGYSSLSALSRRRRAWRAAEGGDDQSPGSDLPEEPTAR